MNNQPVNPYSSHQEISLLLPWYVNNTLSALETKAVESHIKVCLTCKRELAQLNKLAYAVANTDTLSSAAQASFSQLQKRIHQHESSFEKPRIPAKSTSLQRFIANGLNFFNKPYLVPAMMALFLTASIPSYLVFDQFRGNEYRTLSNSQNLDQSNDIKIIFADSVDRQEIKLLIQQAHGQIIDGPTKDGIYLIRLQEIGKDQNRPILDTLNSLRKNTNVVFAEPAHTSLSSP
jgi:hypothetical protein